MSSRYTVGLAQVLYRSGPSCHCRSSPSLYKHFAAKSLHTRSSPGPSAFRTRPAPKAVVSPISFSSHRPPSSPPPSVLSQLGSSFGPLRVFSTSRTSLVRPNYFPPNQRFGGGGGGGGGPWFSSAWRRLRYRINAIPNNYIIYGLIGSNVVIFLLWEYARTSFKRFNDPSLLVFMVNNFLFTEANLLAGRIWTVVTACFSHATGDHIFFNCLGLYFVCPMALQVMGAFNFLGMYLAGGAMGFLTSMAWQHLSGRRESSTSGASAAVFACLSFYATLAPRTPILLYFIIPLPVWLAVGGIFAVSLQLCSSRPASQVHRGATTVQHESVAEKHGRGHTKPCEPKCDQSADCPQWDAYSVLARPHSTTDSAAHIGGLLTGVLAALRVRRMGFRGF